MNQRIALVSLVVKEYDEAIEFYTKKLGFILVEDTVLNEAKRWVVVAPKSAGDNAALLLAKAATDEQKGSVGNQSGGRVFLFLHTDDFWRDYEDMKDKGIVFTREPVQEDYGTVAVFKDLYGNQWDLVEPRDNLVNPVI